MSTLCVCCVVWCGKPHNTPSTPAGKSRCFVMMDDAGAMTRGMHIDGPHALQAATASPPLPGSDSRDCVYCACMHALCCVCALARRPTYHCTGNASIPQEKGRQKDFRASDMQQHETETLSLLLHFAQCSRG